MNNIRFRIRCFASGEGLSLLGFCKTRTGNDASTRKPYQYEVPKKPQKPQKGREDVGTGGVARGSTRHADDDDAGSDGDIK